MTEAFTITVDSVSRKVGDHDAMEVKFTVEDRTTFFQVPVLVSRSYVPDDEWVKEAKALLHGAFTQLAEQTASWASPSDKPEG